MGGLGASPPGLVKRDPVPPPAEMNCVFQVITSGRVFQFCQRRSMKTTRDHDLAYLSYESKVLMEDITFDELFGEWSSKPSRLGNQLLRFFHDFRIFW